MNKSIFRSVIAVLSACGVFLAAGTGSEAVDRNHRYFAYGLGQRSCEDYVKVREKRFDALEREHPRFTREELYEVVDRVVGHWIAGFLTAHNLYMSDTYDVAGKTNMEELKARLEKVCRADPKQYFAQAMVAVVQQLNPQRVRAGDGK